MAGLRCSVRGHDRHLFGDITDTLWFGQVDSCDLVGGEEDALRLDHVRLERQGPQVLRLLKSLVDRGAIPEARLRYWSDPEYQIGRVKASHKGLFERNGIQGQEIYTNPHILEYLRYFLFGAQFPQQEIAEF